MKTLLALAVVLVGALGAYHALVFYDNDFRYGRMRETPAVKPHEEPLIGMEAGIVPVAGGEALLRATPESMIKPPLAMEAAEVISRGKAVYLPFARSAMGRTTTETAPLVRVSHRCRPISARPPCSPSRPGRFSRA